MPWVCALLRTIDEPLRHGPDLLRRAALRRAGANNKPGRAQSGTAVCVGRDNPIRSFLVTNAVKAEQILCEQKTDGEPFLSAKVGFE